MAREENTGNEENKIEDDVTEKNPARTPKKKFMKLAIIGAGIVLILGGGYAGWKLFIHKGGDGSSAAATDGHAKKEFTGQIVTLDPFIINLADPSESIYLKVAINLEVDSEIVVEEIQKRMPQIRDTILMLLTSKTAEDVRSTGGKLKLQEDMVVRINHYLQTGKVKAVYFTEFVMQ
ncbi:MAG: flagellar basal body-associated FliL family protein [Nitrospirae bacterium]|nr:flagellar basal body-associated FliL family protein [Nitrospirota bacterium]